MGLILFLIIVTGVLVVVGAVAYLFYGLAQAQREHREKHDGGML